MTSSINKKCLSQDPGVERLMRDRCFIGQYYKEYLSINEMLLWAMDSISFNQWTFFIPFTKRYSVESVQDILHWTWGHIFSFTHIPSWYLLLSLLKYAFYFFPHFLSLKICRTLYFKEFTEYQLWDGKWHRAGLKIQSGSSKLWQHCNLMEKSKIPTHVRDNEGHFIAQFEFPLFEMT